MKNIFSRSVDKLVSKVLKVNVNSTTSVTAFQPAIPTELKKLSKFINEQWLINSHWKQPNGLQVDIIHIMII